MGIVYYGLNLKSICVEQSSVVFVLRYDYLPQSREKPTVHLNDFVCVIDRKDCEQLTYTVGYHSDFAEILIKVNNIPKTQSLVLDWLLSGEIVLQYSDVQQEQCLYFDFQSSFVKKSALRQ